MSVVVSTIRRREESWERIRLASCNWSLCKEAAMSKGVASNCWKCSIRGLLAEFSEAACRVICKASWSRNWRRGIILIIIPAITGSHSIANSLKMRQMSQVDSWIGKTTSVIWKLHRSRIQCGCQIWAKDIHRVRACKSCLKSTKSWLEAISRQINRTWDKRVISRNRCYSPTEA